LEFSIDWIRIDFGFAGQSFAGTLLHNIATALIVLPVALPSPNSGKGSFTGQQLVEDHASAAIRIFDLYREETEERFPE